MKKLSDPCVRRAWVLAVPPRQHSPLGERRQIAKARIGLICLGVNSGDDRQARTAVKRGLVTRALRLVIGINTPKPITNFSPTSSYVRPVQLTGLWSGVLLCSIALAQPLPPVLPLKVDTNRYWLPFAWDTVSNATSYSVSAFSNSVLQQLISVTTNYAAVSNLPSTLDNWQFMAQAVNGASVSDYSLAAPLHWSTLYASDDMSQWFKAPGVEYDPSTNASRFLRLSNWNYQTELRRQ